MLTNNLKLMLVLQHLVQATFKQQLLVTKNTALCFAYLNEPFPRYIHLIADAWIRNETKQS